MTAAATHVTGGAVAALAFSAPGAGRDVARAQGGQRPHRGSARNRSIVIRKTCGTGANEPGTGRPPPLPPARRDPQVRAAAPGRPVRQRRQLRRRGDLPGAHARRVSRRSTASTARWSWCHGGGIGAAAGIPPGRSSRCPAGGDSIRLPGSDPAPARTPDRASRPGGGLASRILFSTPGKLTASARGGDAASAAAAPVTGSSSPAREGWHRIDGRPQPAVGAHTPATTTPRRDRAGQRRRRRRHPASVVLLLKACRSRCGVTLSPGPPAGGGGQQIAHRPRRIGAPTGPRNRFTSTKSPPAAREMVIRSSV